MCTTARRRKGCGLLTGQEEVWTAEGAERGVNWCGSQEAVCTVKGDRKWCRLVREAKRGAHC